MHERRAEETALGPEHRVRKAYRSPNRQQSIADERVGTEYLHVEEVVVEIEEP